MGTVQSKLKEVGGQRTSCCLTSPSPQGSCDPRLQQPLSATAPKQLLFQVYNHFCFSTLRAGVRPCRRRAGHAWLNEIVQWCLLTVVSLGVTNAFSSEKYELVFSHPHQMPQALPALSWGSWGSFFICLCLY